ncbi:hypothetical protein ACQPVA_18260 [Clostridium butyricum]|uniref:Uncharacterized protein n=1 Tax=Clostridium butyricum TaxID=1492 RepID=A0A2S7F8M7_CLOBU|nr:hypothetical protein [Clostridium butyricum]KHD14918.1 hypothetical protein OA81_12515 [Clostridium butyricum]PPV13379.1 hypothetical protein AWN73_16425 [Clostridium butyricum]
MKKRFIKSISGLLMCLSVMSTSVIASENNEFVKNLSTGKHTFEVRISSTNTTPYRSLVAKATFNIPD